DDDRPDRAVAEAKRHDRGSAERAGRVAAGDAERERGDAGLVGSERFENRADRYVARGVMVGTGADEGEHAARVGDGDGAEAELLEDLVRDGPGGCVGEAEPQLRQRRGEQLERRGLAAQPANAGHGFRTVPSASCTSGGYASRSATTCGIFVIRGPGQSRASSH